MKTTVLRVCQPRDWNDLALSWKLFCSCASQENRTVCHCNGYCSSAHAPAFCRPCTLHNLQRSRITLLCIPTQYNRCCFQVYFPGSPAVELAVSSDSQNAITLTSSLKSQEYSIPHDVSLSRSRLALTNTSI